MGRLSFPFPTSHNPDNGTCDSGYATSPHALDTPLPLSKCSTCGGGVEYQRHHMPSILHSPSTSGALGPVFNYPGMSCVIRLEPQINLLQRLHVLGTILRHVMNGFLVSRQSPQPPARPL